VDVGAKHEIYELIFELAAQGSAIVLITSEMPECLALSDRIMVMHRGKVSATFTQAEATQEKILKAAMGEDVA
jgi:ABC-type sugar transport system ATPase subunit